MCQCSYFLFWVIKPDSYSKLIHWYARRWKSGRNSKGHISQTGRGIRLITIHNGSMEIDRSNTVYCACAVSFCPELSSQKFHRNSSTGMPVDENLEEIQRVIYHRQWEVSGLFQYTMEALRLLYQTSLLCQCWYFRLLVMNPERPFETHQCVEGGSNL